MKHFSYPTAPIVMALLNYFTERQVCIFGGLLSGFGYIYCGFLMNSVIDLFVGLSISGRFRVKNNFVKVHLK